MGATSPTMSFDRLDLGQRPAAADMEEDHERQQRALDGGVSGSW